MPSSSSCFLDPFYQCLTHSKKEKIPELNLHVQAQHFSCDRPTTLDFRNKKSRELEV